MTSYSIAQVANYKPLSRCGMEEIAGWQQSSTPSGGVMFARSAERKEKDAARLAILDLFRPDRWECNLRILTMPGLNWRFERKLLGLREGDWMKRGGPSRTYFTSFENDRAIYLASVAQMPGTETPKRCLRQSKLPFSEMGICTNFGAHYFANVDDLLKTEHSWRTPWGAAWLDYTGPLTIERLRAIQQFFDRSVTGVLVVTALKARWNKATSNAVEKAGGHSEWLRQNLGGEVLHDLEYFDTSPMAQFAVTKKAAATLAA